MPSYDHNKMIERIGRLNAVPEDAQEYASWIQAGGHLRFMRETANEEELLIYALGEYGFIHAVVVSEASLSPLDQADLLNWSGTPYCSRAGYAWGGGRDDVWIERGDPISNSESLKDAMQLVFARDLEGMKGSDRVYFEILQEYSHLSGIHWRPELRAYCRFDEQGDWEQVVSVTSRETKGGVTLVSFKRENLEKYLAVSNSVLVRMFDFTLFRRSEFTHWPEGPDHIVVENDSFFYRQKIDAGRAAYTRGVQIVRPNRTRVQILASITDGWLGQPNRQYCEFIAWDWRNRRVATISTDPSATTNYFVAPQNSLPFEVSPAFFRPEVLSKYKADRDKFTISEENRYIDGRGGWELRSYDINEAGQVFAYICYLRSLPYQEQLYWKSFNEEPKSGISERALLNDFKGEWADSEQPLGDLLSTLREWDSKDVPWWKLGSEALLAVVNTPYTSSVEEWSRAFLDLAKLLVEGFQRGAIRNELQGHGIPFEKEEKSIALLEKLIITIGSLSKEERLNGLRELQRVRSLVASHAPGSEAAELTRNALEQHGSYMVHFESVCVTISDELALIEKAFSGRP